MVVPARFLPRNYDYVCENGRGRQSLAIRAAGVQHLNNRGCPPTGTAVALSSL
jgi:hypothetical protein